MKPETLDPETLNVSGKQVISLRTDYIITTGEEVNLPQSRHRKINKAKKRPRGMYPTASSGTPTGKNRNIRIIAIVIVAVLALSAVGYVLSKRGDNVGTEVTTASGLKYIDQVVGTGASPQRGQTVTVHYTGTLTNGKKFQSSLDSGRPAEFRVGVGALIKGWDEGIMSMKVGGKRRLTVPPNLGYGPLGKPPDIPGNSTLIFDIELLGIK